MSNDDPSAGLEDLSARVAAVIDTLGKAPPPSGAAPDLPVPELAGDETDLKTVLGIGPALAHRLGMLGIRSTRDIAAMGPDALSRKLGPLVGEDTVAGWILKAGSRRLGLDTEN